jgi:hypothetical protein
MIIRDVLKLALDFAQEWTLQIVNEECHSRLRQNPMVRPV